MRLALFSYHGNPVRAGAHDGEPWFVGGDIASILGYKDCRAAVNKYVEPEERVPMMFHCEEHDHDHRVDLISFYGVHTLLINAEGADFEEVARFKIWLADVAAVIRYGGFDHDEGDG